MCVAAAIAGGAVVGGVVQSVGARNAARTQARAAAQASDTTLQATRETNALNYALYQQQMGNISPGLQIQQSAQAALASGLGLSVPGAFGQQRPDLPSGIPGGKLQPGRTGGPISVQNDQMYDSSYGSGVRPGPLGGIGNYGVNEGGFPGQSFDPNVNMNTEFDIPGIGNVQPRNYGATQGQLNQAGGSYQPGSLTANFTNADLQSQLNPSFDFILNKGQAALTNYNAAHGVSGGQAMRDQVDYTANVASTYYQQAFNNYLTQQQTNIANLQSLAGNGAVNVANAGAQGVAGSITQNTIAGVGASTNYLTSGASATAAGQIGVGNAVSGAIGNATSGYLTNSLIQASLAKAA